MTTTHGRGSTLVATTPFDAWRLLRTAEVARIAWHGPEGVSIVPVNCVVADGALWFRTARDAAVARAGDGLEVAVEVDHLDPVARSGWSVVMRSTVELVDPEAAPDRVGELGVWPDGARPVYVRLRPREVSGRKLVARTPSEHGGAEPLD